MMKGQPQSTSKQQQSINTHWLFRVSSAVGLVSIVIAVRNATYAQHPLAYLVPNVLMYTPFREATLAAWDRVLQYDRVEKDPVPIAEMNAADYSYDALRKLTHGFRSPAVVRGMFANTTAVARWTEPGYMASQIGKFEINAIQGGFADIMDEERSTKYESFGDVYESILRDEDSIKYLFFPDASRHGSNEMQFDQTQLVDTVNGMVRVDLDLDRIWHGFGLHRTFIIAQIIAGRGRPSPDLRPTGSNWHCAIGNNWFAQVAGGKRWFFLDQKHTAWLKPMRAGVNSFFTGATDMQELQKYLPTQYADLQAGDLLYNPDFMWHAVVNHQPGLTIGVPIREFNVTLAVRNNMQLTSIVAINNLLQLFGFAYGLSGHKEKD